MIPYTPPKFRAAAFNCPHCKAYAQQTWDDADPTIELYVTECAYCEGCTIWHMGRMLYPEDLGIDPPNSDLDYDIQLDYLEAGRIVHKSHRGAAALLRLCIQKLVIQLGEKGNDLNSAIANLVRRGLPVQIQRALDIVRVIGNNAVHPGQIDLKDDRQSTMKLVELINMIAVVMITQPHGVEKMYESLPQPALEAIHSRDRNGADTTD